MSAAKSSAPARNAPCSRSAAAVVGIHAQFFARWSGSTVAVEPARRRAPRQDARQHRSYLAARSAWPFLRRPFKRRAQLSSAEMTGSRPPRAGQAGWKRRPRGGPTRAPLVGARPLAALGVDHKGRRRQAHLGVPVRDGPAAEGAGATSGRVAALPRLAVEVPALHERHEEALERVLGVELVAPVSLPQERREGLLRARVARGDVRRPV